MVRGVHRPVEDHDGILLKVEGDSFLVIFRNPAKAQEILATESVKQRAADVAGVSFEAITDAPLGVGTCYRVAYSLGN